MIKILFFLTRSDRKKVELSTLNSDLVFVRKSRIDQAKWKMTSRLQLSGNHFLPPPSTSPNIPDLHTMKSVVATVRTTQVLISPSLFSCYALFHPSNTQWARPNIEFKRACVCSPALYKFGVLCACLYNISSLKTSTVPSRSTALWVCTTNLQRREKESTRSPSTLPPLQAHITILLNMKGKTV